MAVVAESFGLVAWDGCMCKGPSLTPHVHSLNVMVRVYHHCDMVNRCKAGLLQVAAAGVNHAVESVTTP